MRIIAGKYGGRRLTVPRNRDIRPTSDKIRGAIFNALEAQGVIQEAYILDAFCGSGALGLEALSRGAKHVTFVDKAKTSINLTHQNTEALGACTESDFILGDAPKLRFKDRKFDLIFLDPPYHKGLITLTLNNILKQGTFSPTTRFICESEHDAKEIHNGSLTLYSQKSYGDTLIRFYELKN